MNRLLAYLIIAVIGFLIGSAMYYAALWLLNTLEQLSPTIWGLIIQVKEYTGVLVSGFLGSFVAVLSAYLWAKSTSRY